MISYRFHLLRYQLRWFDIVIFNIWSVVDVQSKQAILLTTGSDWLGVLDIKKHYKTFDEKKVQEPT